MNSIETEFTSETSGPGKETKVTESPITEVDSNTSLSETVNILEERTSRLASLVTHHDLFREVKRRLGTLLRVCGLRLQIRPGHIHITGADDSRYREIVVPLRCTDVRQRLR